MEPEYSRYWQVATNAVRVGTKMDKPEPLIAMYNLASWKNPSYTGSDINKISTPKILSTRYRGIVRSPSFPYAALADNDDDDDNDMPINNTADNL